MKEKTKSMKKAWGFLGGVMIIYLILFLLKKEIFYLSGNYFLDILIKVIPAFILVLVLMFILNLFITPEFISKHLKEKGIKKWIYVVVAGFFSTGPIYAWYPLLADLREKGLSYGLMATFLYNWAIKIPLLPLMIFYFSLKYAVVLVIVMVFASIIEGRIMGWLMGDEK